MKNSSLSAILLGLLAVSTLAAVVLTMLYSGNVREMRQLQAQVNLVNNNRASAQQMVMELLEYSKTHPGIDPLLQQAGLKPGGAAAKPAGK